MHLNCGQNVAFQIAFWDCPRRRSISSPEEQADDSLDDPSGDEIVPQQLSWKNQLKRKTMISKRESISSASTESNSEEIGEASSVIQTKLFAGDTSASFSKEIVKRRHRI
jgi:hypothetical protein